MEFEVDEIFPQEYVGWLKAELPKFVMTKLQSYIEEAKINPVNHNARLAGNITKSLTLKDKDDWFFQTILAPLIEQFDKSFPNYANQMKVLTENAPYGLDELWVNFQKQHEFNPSHNHNGVFSFVIWVKIPTDWREQHSLPISANSNSPVASNFEFRYTSMLGNISYYSYLLEKKSEGHMIFFPAKLQHIVYPFYNCDKERISISGNIFFDISENSMRQYRART